MAGFKRLALGWIEGREVKISGHDDNFLSYCQFYVDVGVTLFRQANRN